MDDTILSHSVHVSLEWRTRTPERLNEMHFSEARPPQARAIILRD